MLNERKVASDELGCGRKQVSLILKVLFVNINGGIEENHGNLETG
jgi:hypothetical protein